MEVEILTPDEEVYKGEVDSIIAPGLDGYLGILNNHAPLIASLQKGRLTITPKEDAQHFDSQEGKMLHTLSDDKKSIIFEINGGTIEVKKNKAIILAE
jgi:F-type H+-transporting ATPase subunit epsilon